MGEKATRARRGRAHVLVLGAERSALAAVRDLSRAGWSVDVAHHRHDARIAAVSRHVRRRWTVPDPHEDLEVFRQHLARLDQQQVYDVILPSADDYLAALALCRDDVHASVPLAPTSSVLRVLDKVAIEDDLRHAGFHVPVSRDATDAVLADWDGPAIVKDRSHWNPAHTGSGRCRAVLSTSPAELREAVASMRRAGGAPTLQEPAGGRMYCLGAFRSTDGHVSGFVQQTSDHLWPLPLGTTSRAVTTAVDDTARHRLHRLLDRLAWTGMVNLQLFRQDDGSDVVIDVNGRFNHSLALAVAAGVRFPRAWAALGRGARRVDLPDAPPGVRISFLLLDTKRALVERRGGTVPDLMETWRFAMRAHHPVLAPRDPAPALSYALAGVGRRMGRAGTG